MPFISGGGGGGGGVTPPVTITGTDPDTAPLTVEGAAGQQVDILAVMDGDAAEKRIEVAAAGDSVGVTVKGDPFTGPGRLRVSSDGIRVWDENNDTTIATSSGGVDLGADGVVGALGPSGYLYTGHGSAPADGDLFPGYLTFWFDSTNGAAKLMVGAKTANGTVVAAAITLA